jgi:hypothetical protein
MLELNVYCGPLLKSLPCSFHNTGREIVWTIGPVNEYEAQTAIIPFVGVITRKQYVLRQQCHFVFISRRVGTKERS